MMKNKLTGSQVIVPMASPFNSDHSIDEAAVSRICAMFVKAGVSVFVLGTTGEGDSMSQDQRYTLLQLAVKEVNGSSKVYAGLTGNSLSESVKDARKYAGLGADYLVAKLPSYFPMDENQMLSYLERLADSVTLPMFIYNIPATTHHSIPLQVIDRLSHHPRIAGLKDSEQNSDRVDESIRLWGERQDFDYLIGWAAMSAFGLIKGANGIVPGAGNICPELYVQLIDCVRNGDGFRAVKLQEKTDLITALYQKGRILSHSIPALKVMMKIKGLCSGEVLPPMVPMTIIEEETFYSEVKNEWEKLNFR
ncbi:MAG: dihydrodipicolinate synthase family protein [Bacteroidia bacterium]|nr:dihydrodipicolinate synthase family protein [Bacteroidia bacterium]